MNDIVITEQMIRDIADSEAEFCRKVRKCDPLQAARNLTSGHKGQLDYLAKYFGREALEKSDILEIGSGNGFFLCYALKSGFSIKGVEPGKNYGFEGRHSRAMNLLRQNRIQDPEKYFFDATAEVLPFEDNCFDLVISVAVLEHVKDIELACKESLRVLKPGGILLANMPNYNSIYEGHYDISWIPYMNKTLAKCYVKKLFKRDPLFIDELNFTTPAMFRKYLNTAEAHGKISLHGQGVFRKLLLLHNFLDGHYALKLKPDPSSKKYAREFLKSRYVLPIFKTLLLIPIKFFEFLGFATMFDLILCKKGKDENSVLSGDPRAPSRGE